MERDKMEGEEMKIVHADNFYGTSDVEREMRWQFERDLGKNDFSKMEKL